MWMAEWRPQAGAAALAVVGLVLGAFPVAALQHSLMGRPVDLDATLELRGVVETDGDSTSERPLQRIQVRAAISITDWLRFESVTVGTNGGPTRKSIGSGVYRWDETFQNLSPGLDFEEAYADLFLPFADVRIGKQKLAWGKLDQSAPNDLLNPLSYVDPFLRSEAERKIGVPAVQISYHPPIEGEVVQESRLTAVWVPRYLPYRFPNAGCSLRAGTSQCEVERWYPPAGLPPTAFHVPEGLIELPDGNPNPAFDVPLQFSTSNGSLPSFRLDNSQIGLRYSAMAAGVDFALYYFHGFDRQPAFLLTAEAFAPVEELTGLAVLEPVFREVDAWGFDLAYAFPWLTVRAEWAFVRGRAFSRDLRILITDPAQIVDELQEAFDALAAGAESAPVALPPSFVVRDAVEWGIGADAVYDGYRFLLQATQTDVLNNSVDLLIEDVETRLLGRIEKSFFADTLRARFEAVYGIESDYTLLRPKLRYALTDHISAEIGYLFIAGRASSVLGQYKDNDQGFVIVEARL
jgi:hypothetical protein